MDLTERERMIAQEAARLAVERLTEDFYKHVGKNVINKFFIVIGALAVGFLAGKGFIKFL